MSDQSVPRPRANPRPDIEFTPVTNGLDYLISAVKHLTEGATPPDARDLKYAVLHLQAATEVLLKARLIQEHWSLVFSDPGSATIEAFTSGNFETCNTDAALRRLEKIAQVKITDDDRDAIRKLKRTRNALTHYGHKDNAYAVDAQAAAVLGFLLNFIHHHLSDEPGVEQTMSVLRQKLRGIETLVRDRMNQLSEALRPLADRTVMCPDCAQWALVVGQNEITCLFCLRAFGEPPAAASEYAWMILGEANLGATSRCPTCNTNHVMVMGATVASDKDNNCWLCFACSDLWIRAAPEEVKW
ncbi:hypothetical protein [Streptomyces sp. NPDC048350]|uniref:hypothetical protein n=1 Tax=Streptomyces sp. NPDC048350 TaxID=3365538 RepID=UPI0037167686